MGTEKLNEYRPGRNFIRVGDLARVKPSRKGRHDGFIGRIREIHAREGEVVRIDVVGAPTGRPPVIRSFTPDRIERIAQKRNARAEQQPEL